MTKIAIVLGGSESVWAELKQAWGDVGQAGLGGNTIHFVCNDMIAHFQGACVAVTLHKFKIEGWLNQRRDKHWQSPNSVWFYEPCPHATNIEPLLWAGSVSLYAVQIALRNFECDRVILCGTPMEVMGKHFLRLQPWLACDAFRKPWVDHKNKMLGKVRSYSGWTQWLLGGQPPTVGWLQEVMKVEEARNDQVAVLN